MHLRIAAAAIIVFAGTNGAQAVCIQEINGKRIASNGPNCVMTYQGQSGSIIDQGQPAGPAMDGMPDWMKQSIQQNQHLGNTQDQTGITGAVNSVVNGLGGVIKSAADNAIKGSLGN